MKPKLPPGYCAELDADLLRLRRQDGSTAAVFSARGVAPKLVEKEAWEDYGDIPPSPGGEREKRRTEDNFLAAFLSQLALVVTLRAGLKETFFGSGCTYHRARALLAGRAREVIL